MQRTFWTGISLSLTIILLSGADWPQFRGVESNSVTEGAVPPTEWDADTTAWQVDLPGRGPSGPIVVGSRVLVTCSGGPKQDRLYVICFDADSGSELWRRQFWATGRTASHPSSANAAPTPASDGQAIYAFYSSNDLICLELDGTLRWYRGLAHDYPKAGNDVGMASSPVVVDGVVVVQVENQGDSFAAGIDAKTGETLWRIERARRANWVSPIAIRSSDPNAPPAVLLQSPDTLTAHHARTGEQLWSYDAQCDSVSSALAIPGRVFVPAAGSMVCLDVDRSTPRQLWSSTRMRPQSTSALYRDGRLYSVKSGVLTCGDAAEGQMLWQQRLRGTFWATPAVVGDLMFLVNQDGLVQIVRLGDKRGELIGRYELNETIQGSPAIAGGAVYLRSDGHLWKIAKTQ